MPDQVYHAVRSIQTRELALRWVLNMFAVVHSLAFIALGAILIAGGNRRFSAPALDIARVVPHAPYVWGGVLATCGVLALLSVWARIVPLRIFSFAMAAAWYAFFAITLFLSVSGTHCGIPGQPPCSAYTGVVTYSALAVLCAAHSGTSVIYWRLQ